jgi:hypothetical protein
MQAWFIFIETTHVYIQAIVLFRAQIFENGATTAINKLLAILAK